MPRALGAAFLIDPVPEDVFTPEDFSDEQRAMARTAEEFIDREVVPRLAEIEEKQEGVVPSLLHQAGELGLLAIEVPLTALCKEECLGLNEDGVNLNEHPELAGQRPKPAEVPARIKGLDEALKELDRKSGA